MTTGMKKFTKGCLLTALVTFIIGAVICGVGGLLGGFRVLNSMDIREITGIPFVYSKGSFYGFRLWDDNDIDWGKYENWNRIDSTSGGSVTELDITADTLRNLYIESGACELYIEKSEDDRVRLAMSGDTNTLRYHVENGNLWIIRRSKWNLRWFGINVDESPDLAKVYLYLPERTTFDTIDIQVGAGTMDSIGLSANNANIEVGAGELDIDSLSVNDGVLLTVGAGRIRISEMGCDSAKLNIGAGELDIHSAIIEEDADIDLGMGNAKIGGIIRGNLDVDCGMGEVELDMDDAEQNHNYEIDCSMGTVKVGSRSYSGMGSSQTINNGSDSDYNIDCSMGTVTVRFAQ